MQAEIQLTIVCACAHANLKFDFVSLSVMYSFQKDCCAICTTQ